MHLEVIHEYKTARHAHYFIWWPFYCAHQSVRPRYASVFKHVETKAWQLCVRMLYISYCKQKKVLQDLRQSFSDDFSVPALAASCPAN